MDDTFEQQWKQSLLAEQKSARRWKNFRFIVWVCLFLFTFLFSFGPFFWHTATDAGLHGSYVSLLHLEGEIASDSPFSAETVIPQLNKAFKDSAAKGVVLLMNSPGGSPVQASIIHDKILQLKEKYHKKVIVVAEDTLASGAYLVATAADKIYVNADTLTGSIGVIMSGFGFKDAIEKIGVTRRVFTAGHNKNRLDPFQPLTSDDVKKIHQLLSEVHQSFINDVTEGRHGKLHGEPAELFSGDFWTGTQSVKLGLADATANVWEAMEDNFKTTQYRDYTPEPPFWETLARDMSSELHLTLSNHHTSLQAVL